MILVPSRALFALRNGAIVFASIVAGLLVAAVVAYLVLGCGRDFLPACTPDQNCAPVEPNPASTVVGPERATRDAGPLDAGRQESGAIASAVAPRIHGALR